MASTAREYLWLIEESSYLTSVASPVVGTSQFLVPLVESNAYPTGEEVELVDTPFGGGLDVVAESSGDFHTVKGSFSTLGYPALTAFLMKAAVTRVNAGQTLPWVNTEPFMDLASFTAWHVFRGRDGALVKKQHVGGKILSLAGSISRTDPRLKFKVDVQFSKELPNPVDSSVAGTAPADPTDAQYPRGPYLFSHTKGNILLGGSALTMYEDLSFTITNKADPHAFENNWVQTLGILGRAATADINLLLRSSTDLRATYLALTSQGFSIEFNNGVNTGTLGFNANNHINKLPYDMPLGKEFMQKASFVNKYDPSAGTDLTWTST
jgi:tail tube protein